MNKRIDELVTATDAWCDQNLPTHWTDDVDKYLPVWNEKFAQLIVRECVDYAFSDDYERQQMLKHFGVEE